MWRGPLAYGQAGATRIFWDSARSFAARKRATDHTNEQRGDCERGCREECEEHVRVRAAAVRRRSDGRRQGARSVPAYRLDMGSCFTCGDAALCPDSAAVERADDDVPRADRRVSERLRQAPDRIQHGGRARDDESVCDVVVDRPRRRFGCSWSDRRNLGSGCAVDSRCGLGRNGRRRRRSRVEHRLCHWFGGRRCGRRDVGLLDDRRGCRRRHVDRRRSRCGRHGGGRFDCRRRCRGGDGRRRCSRVRGRRGNARRRRVHRRARRRSGRRRRRRRERRQERERVEIPLVVVRRADAEVDVRDIELGRAARADGSERGTLGDERPLRDGEGAEVRQRDGERVLSGDGERLAARRHGARKRDGARRRRHDRRPVRRTDVDATVLPARVRVRGVERERREHGALHGPRPRAGGGDAEQRQHEDGGESAHGKFSFVVRGENESAPS
jgi:hypothetical protein